MAERSLKKFHGNIKVSIVRPSIVVSSFEEPMLGWTETISAMGGMTFAVMLGLVNYLNCDQQMVIDCIPVDYVSNLIIATTAYTA